MGDAGGDRVAARLIDAEHKAVVAPKAGAGGLVDLAIRDGSSDVEAHIVGCELVGSALDAVSPGENRIVEAGGTLVGNNGGVAVQGCHFHALIVYQHKVGEASYALLQTLVEPAVGNLQLLGHRNAVVIFQIEQLVAIYALSQTLEGPTVVDSRGIGEAGVVEQEERSLALGAEVGGGGIRYAAGDKGDREAGVVLDEEVGGALDAHQRGIGKALVDIVASAVVDQREVVTRGVEQLRSQEHRGEPRLAPGAPIIVKRQQRIDISLQAVGGGKYLEAHLDALSQVD